MQERYVAAQPGMVPAVSRTAGTMFAAVYGSLVPHAWHDPESVHDAYQLFHQRSLAMGWIDDRSAGEGEEGRFVRTPGLWAMNDAGWSHPLAAPDADLIAWFQVEASAVAHDRPLPVQPFLRCAQDVMARVGTMSLSAVQVLLPVQGFGITSGASRMSVPSMQTVHWLGEHDPRSRTQVEISIDSGRDPSIPAASDQIREYISRLDQSVFVCTSHSAGGRPAIDPPFDDTFWNGPPLHRAMFSGELAEWSLDALGWLAGFLADLSVRSGATTPLLLTVVRSSAASSTRRHGSSSW